MFFNKEKKQQELQDYGQMTTLSFVFALCKKIGMTPKELIDLSDDRTEQLKFVNELLKTKLDNMADKLKEDN